MMPVSASTSNHQDGTNYKKKYKNLKKKLHLLVYEQECFTEELKKCQRRLLKLSKDRSFLLDRLLQYEKIEETSSDSEATASSDSDNEAGKDGSSAKKKKTSSAGQMALMSASILGSPEYQSLIAAQSLTLLGQGGSTSSKTGEPPKKRAKVTKKAAKQAQNKTSAGSSSMPGPPGSPPIAGLLRPPPGHMTREELERHLELKQSNKPQFMAFENAPHSLPDDIFSHDNSNQDGELMTDTRRLHPK